jgi:SM-20-related protein
MIDLRQFARRTLQTQPYEWAAVSDLFSRRDGAALAESFPGDHFKTVKDDDGEKEYEYEARELIAMGEATLSHSEDLSPAWIALAHDFLSSEYRVALSLLTGHDLRSAPMEVNVFHYGPRARLGPHADLEDKVATHVLYFNESWDREDGGCLTILRSADPADVAAEILPVIGNSAVLVRSERSWHAVPQVVNNCNSSRRSLTATFYRPGSISTMWPPGDKTALHRYDAPDRVLSSRGRPGLAARVKHAMLRLRNAK